MLLLIWSLIVGVAFLLGAPPPGSIAMLMPRWETLAWASGLLLSGVVGLIGVWWRDWENSMRLEQAAMLFGAAAILMYCVSAFSIAGWRALFAGGLTGTWCAANLWRANQIRRDLRGLRRPP